MLAVSKKILYLLSYLSTLGAWTSSFSSEKPMTLKPCASDQLCLSAKALGKSQTFLWLESLITNDYTPQFESLGTRKSLVHFERKGHALLLYQAVDGQQVDLDRAENFLIYKFPITHEQDGWIQFDFSAGVRDVSMSDYVSKGTEIGYRIDKNVVTNMFIAKSGALVIDQEGQLLPFDIGQRLSLAARMRYMISSYSKNESFAAKEGSRFENVGFFESPSVVEPGSGRAVNYIARWDISKPIVFHVSAKVPEDFREAVKAGVRYWDEIIPGFKVVVEDAPEGIRAPHPDYNLIEWVDWKNAGYAYADFSVDPLSGEMMHASVFMTSSWAFYSAQQVRRLLRTLEEQSENTKDKGFHLSKHQNTLSCHHNTKELRDSLRQILSMQQDDKLLLQLSQEMIANVVAHEIGHTLGLRHNFAGHTAASLSPLEIDQELEDHLNDPEKELSRNLEVSSTVMDYPSFAVDILIGNQVMKGTYEAFEYDKLAIEWGYNTEKREEEYDFIGPLFCTDGAASRKIYADCGRFLLGANVFSGPVHQLGKSISFIPYSILEHYIGKNAPINPLDAVPIRKVDLEPLVRSISNNMIYEYKSILSRFSGKMRSLEVERSKAYVDNFDDYARQAQYVEWVNSHAKAFGGANTLLVTVFENAGFLDIGRVSKVSSIPAFNNALEQLIADVANTEERETESLAKALPEKWGANAMNNWIELTEDEYSFVGADGKTHTFDADDLSIIRRQGLKAMQKIFRSSLRGLLQAIADSSFDLESKTFEYPKNEGIEMLLERQVGKIAKAIILPESNSEFVNGTWKNSKIFYRTVPQFVYPHDIRLAATGILSKEKHSAWGAQDRKNISEALNQKIKKYLGMGICNVESDELSLPLRVWLEKQKDIYFSLTSRCN